MAQPAGHIKRWGAGEIEKERAILGQRGVSRKLGVLGFFETAEGTGCAPLW